MEDKKNNRGLVILLALFIILTTLLGGYVIYDKLVAPNNKIDTEKKDSEEDNTNTEESNSMSVNKRLYSVDSEMYKQRYYLLLEDATYDMNQNFLNKKTYILDLNMVDGNQLVKEIDFASVFTPIANEYINSHKGNNSGTCSVAYFSANRGTTPPPIDYEKEVAFGGYYRCINNNVETSLGSEIYAYNVETNTIRFLSSKN